MALCPKCKLPDCTTTETHVLVQFNEDHCINGRFYKNGQIDALPTRIHAAHNNGASSNGATARRTVKNSNYAG